MSACFRVRAVAAVLVGLMAMAPASLAAQRGAPPAFSPADAERFERKLGIITEIGVRAATSPSQKGPGQRTVVSEAEVNAYLRLRAVAQLPKGVMDPYIAALGAGRVSGSAVVDLDAVRTSRERGMLDPAQLLSGRLPVSVTGVLRTKAGVATFELESASVSGIPIPKALLQELVTYYSRSAEHPDGISVDAQFLLPSGIREIAIQAHQAVVVQ